MADKGYVGDPTKINRVIERLLESKLSAALTLFKTAVEMDVFIRSVSPLSSVRFAQFVVDINPKIHHCNH